MVKVYLSWIYWLLALIVMEPIIAASFLASNFGANPLIMLALALVVCISVAVIFYRFNRTFDSVKSAVEDDARAFSDFVDQIPLKYTGLAIAASAGVGLFLELSMIRWQGTVFEVFAFYKNFSLLSCFAGLGIGYAVSSRKQIPLIAVFPLMALQFVFLLALRHSLGGTLNYFVIKLMPISEQIHLDCPTATSWVQLGVVYFFLTIVFLLTALALVPIGQLAGALMSRVEPLKAYGQNLLGSLCGIVLTFALSFLWTPPAVWFSVVFAVLLFFQLHRTRSLLISSVFSIVAVIALSWPVAFGSEVIYSPYQILERAGTSHGLAFIKAAAGMYYQKIFDCSPPIQQAFPDIKITADNYELAYQFHVPPGDVAICGAGSGNDASAALRRGAAHVDAVELDPAIAAIGKAYHPEHPYDDPRVRVILNDARAFLRSSPNKYDMICFGALDAHTAVSSGSALRVDSYVYTVESLKDARALLKPGGVLSLCFDAGSKDLLAKIYHMMQLAFDGKPPLAIYCAEGSLLHNCTFIQSKEGTLSASDLPPAVASNPHMPDATADLQNLSKDIDPSTDDWPFLYMFKRVYPFSYLLMFALVAALTYVLIRSFQSGGALGNNWVFLFMGAGFMLIETKAITELALSFGNTWYVAGIVIAAIVLMAYFANWVVSRVKINLLVPAALLMLSLAGGLALAHSGWLPSNAADKLLIVFVLTLPVFFSGMVFSILIGSQKEIAPAMAANLLGAMLGGLLEYNAMYCGYAALYVIALLVYALAFLSLKWRTNSQVVSSSPSAG